MLEADKVQLIHESPYHGVLAISGGGSEVAGSLLRYGGGSQTILDIQIPYATEAFVQFIGHAPKKFCSSTAARALAMAAYERARKIAPSDAHEKPLFGVGVSCSLAKKEGERVGRENVAYIAIQTPFSTQVQKIIFEKKDRSYQERAVSDAVLDLLLILCITQPSFGAKKAILEVNANPELLAFYSGDVDVFFPKLEDIPRYEPPSAGVNLVLPGSFNPLHDGHTTMAGIASGYYNNQKVYYEISLNNVDKPKIDLIELAHRCEQFEDSKYGLVLTKAPTFLEKAALFSPCVFIVGIDTWKRVINPSYYASVDARDTALAKMKEMNASFLVFGRKINGVHHALRGVDSFGIAKAVPEFDDSEFNAINSTAIRDETTKTHKWIQDL